VPLRANAISLLICLAASSSLILTVVAELAASVAAPEPRGAAPAGWVRTAMLIITTRLDDLAESI